MLQPLLYGVLFPGLVAAVVAAAAAVLGRSREGLASVGLAVAVAAGLVTASVGLIGWQQALPADTTHRLPHLAVLAVLAAAATVPARRPGASSMARVGAFSAIVVAALLGAWLLLGPLASRGTVGAGVVLLGGSAAAMAVAGVACARAVRDEPPWLGGLLLALTGAAVGGACVLGRTLLVGQLAGAVAAAVAGAAAAALVLRRRPPWDGAGLVAGMLLAACAVLARAYASLQLPTLVGLAALPLALWAVSRWWRAGGKLAIVARIAAVVIVGGAAVGWAAWQDLTADEQGDYGYGEGTGDEGSGESDDDYGYGY